MKLSKLFPWLTALCLALPSIVMGQGEQTANKFKVLVFSKTLLYRHASITNGVAALKQLGATNHFSVDATEDSAAFTAANLAQYKVVVFLSTSGHVFNEAQEEAFKNYVEGGGGFVGIHAPTAGDVGTEGPWAWYGETLCAKFTNHSRVVQATIDVEDHKHPSTAGLPAKWVRKDEWYNFITSPRGQAHVLASMDETTYKGGTMGKDHPIAWYRSVGKGRLWYTALGHTESSFSEPLFLKHLLGGIQYAAGAPGGRPE